MELLGDIAVILLVPGRAALTPSFVLGHFSVCPGAWVTGAPRRAPPRPTRPGSGIIVFVCVVGEVAYAHVSGGL